MIEDQLKLAKLACRQMQKVDKYTKMNALDAISKGLLENIEYILAENAKDINNLGNLIVKCDNQEYTLNSGEVSIIQKNYE